MARVFFGQLAKEVTEKDIEKLLRPYGPVRDIYVRDGFGFVEFSHFKDADDCIFELNGKDFFGEKMIVEHARTHKERERRGPPPPFRERSRERRGGPPIRTPNRIICENIPFTSSWQDLKDFVRPVAESTFADVHKYRRGEGILEFHTYGDMKNVLEKLQGAEFCGNRLRLTEAPVHNFPRGGFHRDERPRFMGSRYGRERSPRRGRSPPPFRGRSPRRRGYSPSPRRERSFSPRRGGPPGPGPRSPPRFVENGRSPPRFESRRSPPPGRFEHFKSPPRYPLSRNSPPPRVQDDMNNNAIPPRKSPQYTQTQHE